MFKILCAVVVVTSACATTKAQSDSSNAKNAAADVVKVNGEAVIGDRTNCAVTGETFIVKADSEKYVYEGKTYYFCCDGCLDDFKKDPAKYVARIHANAAK